MGATDEALRDIRVLSLRGWPAHDLLLLVRDDIQTPRVPDINGMFGKYKYYE